MIDQEATHEARTTHEATHDDSYCIAAPEGRLILNILQGCSLVAGVHICASALDLATNLGISRYLAPTQ